MKTFIAAVVLATAIASPAVAASAHSQGKTHAAKHTMKRAHVIRTVRPAVAPYGYGAGYVYGGGPLAYSPHSYNPRWNTYVNGDYAGTDPDPLIRMQLRREYCMDRMGGC